LQLLSRYNKNAHKFHFESKASPAECRGGALLRMMDRLEKDNLIRLTEAGYARAVKIRERHMFFKEILMRLGMSAEAAEEAACEMEHGANDEVFELLKRFYAEALNKPCFKLGFEAVSKFV
jgi:Mn-dependent DtxR family transcriptional regulator